MKTILKRCEILYKQLETTKYSPRKITVIYATSVLRYIGDNMIDWKYLKEIYGGRLLSFYKGSLDSAISI